MGIFFVKKNMYMQRRAAQSREPAALLRPPLHSSLRARLENSGAYVVLEVREMTGVTGYKT